MVMRVFAIRNGDYVEFRGALRPPRCLLSKLSKTIMVERREYIYDNTSTVWTPPKMVFKLVPKKIVMKQSFYKGGRFLGTCKYLRFRRLTGQVIKDDKLIEISKLVVKECTK